jgi:hypothetical protein
MSFLNNKIEGFQNLIITTTVTAATAATTAIKATYTFQLKRP